MGAWGKAATARIPLGIWAKVIIPGGYLLQKWNLDPYEGGQNERVVGIRGVENDVFQAITTWGLGVEFSCF